MVSRRHFITTSCLLTASSAAFCRSEELVNSIPTQKHYYANGAEYIKRRKQFLSTHDQKIFLGYPINLNLPSEGFISWQKELAEVEFRTRPMNNVGDPFRKPAVYNSHYLEADLIERFGKRFGFNKNNVWGFLSNSGTDSNLHGAYIGRTLLKQKTGLPPKIYYTSEAHYSVQIITDLLNLEEVLVETNSDGSMNSQNLEEKIKQHNDSPVLVLATIGTTFKGAIDNIDEIQAVIRKHDAYLHLDAALFGGYLHASEFANELKATNKAGKRYDSISISCHKFFGFNSVAGLFLTNKNTFEDFRNYFSQVHDPAYISHIPGTITCSRDPIKPAEFHYYSSAESISKQTEDAKMILSNTEYLLNEMNNHFPELNALKANNMSNTIYFNRVNSKIVKKWTLATVNNDAKNKPSFAHVVVMPHADKTILDQFLSDMEDNKQDLLS